MFKIASLCAFVGLGVATLGLMVFNSFPLVAAGGAITAIALVCVFFLALAGRAN